MAAVHHDIRDLEPGAVLGPYDLLAPVGEGGMARVWAARVRATGQVVALKMLLPELAENVSFQQMFLDEARIASRVRHPNVCGTYELAAYDNVLAIAMEWLDGPSLVRVLRPGPEGAEDLPRVPLPPRLAARIVADACAGLHAAHELVGDDGTPLGVVHRDVSPHNLLFLSDGTLKVTDFGVAKALGKSHMTMAGQLKGKLAYMSPEQLMGGGVDRRSDVFALGCVLYEITTGERPFQGEHDPQVMTAIALGRFEPPSAVARGYPPELEAIVMRALAGEPSDRYPTADAMQRALEGYLRASGPPVSPYQIVTLLQERCGASMAARARVLEGVATARPTRESAASGAGAMEVDRARRSAEPPAERRGFAWVGAAVLLGAALGVGVLSYVRAARNARTSATEAVAVTAPSPPASTAAAPTAPAASSSAPARRGPVHLHIEPSSAIVVVDGVVLPPGTNAVARPEDGGTVEVLVRADKHEDTIVLVDSATPDDVEVALVPAKIKHREKRETAVSAPAKRDASAPREVPFVPVAATTDTTEAPAPTATVPRPIATKETKEANTTNATPGPTATPTPRPTRVPSPEASSTLDAPPNPYE